MRRTAVGCAVAALALAVGLPVWAQTAPAPVVMENPPPPPNQLPELSAQECEVWARELSFAKSVADHDAAAFASHLQSGAAFGASRRAPTRGRQAIAERWAGIIEGKAVRLEWYPTRVTIGGVADVAWSSGPSLFEDRAPDAKQRFSIGSFHSVWHRDADGVWRVLFDDGVEGKPVTSAEAMAFRDARRTACPRG
jgi:ketosteroid isomerase-like protein